ncbi:MAG: adenylosuccinate synthetase [Bacteroidota bacterium]
MQQSIILGLGYGDEGKGLTTDFLCSRSERPLVIRFSGGHQAGHTVVNEQGQRHVFSHFGAGTLRGAPTYWSAFCTFNPLGFWNERQALRDIGVDPEIYIDALAPVTTPYDIAFNRRREKNKQHGSCGLGFGATIARNETPYKLYTQDLRSKAVVKQKLKAIRSYYLHKSSDTDWLKQVDEQVDLFLHLTDELYPQLNIVNEATFFKTLDTYDHLIFEGSQGILLDMDHGFFPNVTYANTTSKNALALLKRNGRFNVPEVYYITRTYQTRHGNGYLSNEHFPLDYTPNPEETNQYNLWQGHQRVSPLDLDMLDYALACDRNYSGNLSKHLVVTCLDQIDGAIKATKQEKMISLENTIAIAQQLETSFKTIYESRSDRGALLVETIVSSFC